jgi:hypothetical protein
MAQRTLANRSWSRSRVLTSQWRPVGCWVWATGIALTGVLSRLWGREVEPGSAASGLGRSPLTTVQFAFTHVYAKLGVKSRMFRPRSCPARRPIDQHPLSALPLNDANLMAGLHAGDRVDTKPTEQGGGVESL